MAWQRRNDEPRKVLQPPLDYHAQQLKADAGSTHFRGDYAYALYASAIAQADGAAGRKQRKADLDAARAQIDGASRKAMRRVVSRSAAARTTSAD